MRGLVSRARIEQLMRRLGRAATGPGRIYLVGGASAVLLGWRESTVDVDMHLDPEPPRVLLEVPAIKEELRVNLELAAPTDFIPEVPGWRDRSRFIIRESEVDFFHYDFYAQALAKIERDHPLDRTDVRAFLERDLIERTRLADFFAAIEPQLHRYPAIEPGRFRRLMDLVTS